MTHKQKKNASNVMLNLTIVVFEGSKCVTLGVDKPVQGAEKGCAIVYWPQYFYTIVQNVP